MPRLKRLFLFTNRETTFTPFQAVATVDDEVATTSIPVRPILPTMITHLHSAPRLLEIHLVPFTRVIRYRHMAEPQTATTSPPALVKIRSFTHHGEIFYHYRISATQFELGTGGYATTKSLASGPSEGGGTIWQDYTDYKGRRVPGDVLHEVYQSAGQSRAWITPGRRLTLPEVAWTVLEKWYETVGRP
jgi:hypothetical protein